MRRLSLAAGLAVVLALGATAALAALRGGQPRLRETAGTFVTRILREELRGQWARQWDELHPGHQRLITRAQYVACSRGLGTNIGDEELTVRGVRAMPIHVPGVPQRTAEVVTITMRRRGSTDAVTYHVHAVSVDGRWAWILGRPFLDAIAHGRCMDGAPLEKPSGTGAAA
ncbi:MAG TPA: hypothetical protein VMT74_02600 [Gaiellaceae bacterium]|nr:hypothetical protein [Gaiellaceae bacterium]